MKPSKKKCCRRAAYARKYAAQGRCVQCGGVPGKYSRCNKCRIKAGQEPDRAFNLRLLDKYCLITIEFRDLVTGRRLMFRPISKGDAIVKLEKFVERVK